MADLRRLSHTSSLRSMSSQATVKVSANRREATASGPALTVVVASSAVVAAIIGAPSMRPWSRTFWRFLFTVRHFNFRGVCSISLLRSLLCVSLVILARPKLLHRFGDQLLRKQWTSWRILLEHGGLSAKNGSTDGCSSMKLRECLRVGFECVRSTAERDKNGRDADVPVTLKSKHDVIFQVRPIEPRRFAQLRNTLGVDEVVFWDGLTKGELTGGEKQPSGKSGALFWVAADGHFVVKTIDRVELGVFMDMFESYTQHLIESPNSLLCRFFGAFEFSFGREHMLVMVMGNVFVGPLWPHAVYDLKGSTEDRWVHPSPGAVLKDLNFADKIIGVPDCRIRGELLNTLKHDVRFLRDRHIMDYSVLLGVHYCDTKAPSDTAAIFGVASPPATLGQHVSQFGILYGFEPSFTCTLVRDQASRRVLYMIGIIDILQKYTWRKRLARAVKLALFGWIRDIEFDTEPPYTYSRRFKTYFAGKVQTFRERGDRVTRFVRRLQTGIDNGTIQRPTFATLGPAALVSSTIACDAESVVTAEVATSNAREGGSICAMKACAGDFVASGGVRTNSCDVASHSDGVATPSVTLATGPCRDLSPRSRRPRRAGTNVGIDAAQPSRVVSSPPPLPLPTVTRVLGGEMEAVTIDEAVDFAVRCGGRLSLLRGRNPWMRSWHEEVEAFLDMDRHALIFQTMSRSIFRQRRETSAVACYRIRRVYLSLICHRPRDRSCVACHSQIKVEAEPAESRRFTVEVDNTALRFTAPSRRQAKLWAIALEVAAAYAEGNVEHNAAGAAAAAVGTVMMPHSVSHLPWQAGGVTPAPPPCLQPSAVVLSMLEPYLQPSDVPQVFAAARLALLGVLEPYLVGPEAERRWEKRRLKRIFTFVDVQGVGGLDSQTVRSLWRELNIPKAEGQAVLDGFRQDERAGRRAGGGRQIGGGRLIHLTDFRRMLQHIDGTYVRAVYESLRSHLSTVMASSTPLDGTSFDVFLGGASRFNSNSVGVSEEGLVQFFTESQRISPPPTVGQVRRLLARLPQPYATRGRWVSMRGMAQLLCSPGNSLVDPAKRRVFQDMNRPLSEYFIESSHNTYLEGNQLSSRSSVLRYVEVLRTGCRCVEIDVWDGADGEPVVKHGYSVTTEVLFEDVVQAIDDHAFVASVYPVILSIEQHCSALQRVRQAHIMTKVFGPRLLVPPWDEKRGCLDFSRVTEISPWSARGCFLVKSSLGCCERCKNPLPVYDKCIALPTLKLSKKEKHELFSNGDETQPFENPNGQERSVCHVSSMTAGKVLTLREAAGEEALRVWNAYFLSRAYPEGTRIGSGNVDPMPLWSCGVQMVALNYQTPDSGLQLNDGLFRSYNGGCGYVLKPVELLGLPPVSRRHPGSRLYLRICCGHRLPRPEDADQGADVSSPMVFVALAPGGQSSQTRVVGQDGYHPVFNHEIEFTLPDSPIVVLTFEVRDAPTGMPIARRAVLLDAVREGFRWVALRSMSGAFIPHGGLLVYAEFRYSTC
eukprot:TRINITY_DN45070_c0_g1_i1.p1 TRINITY_DN45070_c0_g1~~TRINITY_DN45070_c0_g1_i1.p1  ORF type:complete len:1496 (-),score=209.50 TRINITY_DN45070_c0_g1_i1:172-4659(-)